MTASLTRQLAQLLNSDATLPPEGYSIDRMVPRAVVRPADREEVSRVLRWAAAQSVTVFPWGGGVLMRLGNTPERLDLVMDLSRLNRVLDYQPADLTVVVEAGITLAALQQELAQGGQRLPLEGPLPHRATIGGLLAAGVSGPLRYSYGLPRDWLIGIGVVGADGVATRAGGQVVKNVTGYDLNKLYTGSLGSLGVIVEAGFKLAPRPDVWAGVTAWFPNLPEGVAAGRSLVSRVDAPQGVLVVNRTVAGRLGIAGPADADALLTAFSFGRPRAVARRQDAAARRLREMGAVALTDLAAAASQALRQQLTDLGWDAATLPDLGLRVNLPPAAVGPLLASLAPEKAAGLVADPGFGVAQLLRWPAEAAAGETPQSAIGEEAGILEQIAAVRKAAETAGGSVVVEHCPPAVKARLDVWGGAAGPVEGEIMRRIKANFDRQGILNPGRFIGRL